MGFALFFPAELETASQQIFPLMIPKERYQQNRQKTAAKPSNQEEY
jgi:hypothetical protein